MSFWFSFNPPPIDLSGYGDGATIYWAERALAGVSDEDESPGDDGNWTEDNGGALAYSAYDGFGNRLQPEIFLYLVDLVPARALTLALKYNPLWSAGLQRDFQQHLGGEAAIASTAGNLLIGGLQAVTKHWFWGLFDDLPDGYTIFQSATVDDGDWVGAWKEDAPVTSLTMGLALVGVRLDVAGNFEHVIVYIEQSGGTTEADVTIAVDLTNFVNAYHLHKNSFMFFELMPVNPAIVDLLTDPSPSKFRSYFAAMVTQSISWEWQTMVEIGWKPFGTAQILQLFWSGISLSGTHCKYTGDFELPSEARIPPGGLPPMD